MEHSGDEGTHPEDGLPAPLSLTLFPCQFSSVFPLDNDTEKYDMEPELGVHA